MLELEIEELGAGLRPGTPDNLPVIGRGARGARVGHRPLPQRDPARRVTAELVAGALAGDGAARTGPPRATPRASREVAA